MDTNRHSTEPPGPHEPPTPPDGLPGRRELPDRSDELAEYPARSDALVGLAAADQALAAEDLDQLSDTALTEELLALQGWADRLHGHCLRRLAAIDARGAAGADQGQPAASTASWLRNQLRLSASAAHETVQTARALFRGPLPQTAQALTDGLLSPAHARVLAQGTRQVPDSVVRAAEPVLVDAARRLDPPKLRQAVGYLLEVADPDAADAARQRRHERRGLWLSATWDGMVAIDGLLEPEAGGIVRAALEPLARPSDAEDTRKGGQRTADALAELCRRALEGGGLPKGGWGPAPVAGDGGPGQPARPAGRAGWGSGLGRALGSGGLSAAGL